MAMKKNYKYLMVDNDTLKSKLNCLVNELKNIYEDSDGIKYFYGGSKIPAPQFEGYEIECQENVDIINKYLPEIKPSIKGHSNWSNMLKSEKIVGNHLRFFCKVLTDEKMKCKPMRYPKYKSYMVNKYLLPV